MIELKITIGNILASLAIILSAAGLLFSWHKYRKIRQKAYAEKIRKSAGLVIAKLERWKEISLSIFDDVRISIVDADRELSNNASPVEVSDLLWQSIEESNNKSVNRKIDEQIEISYSDLYGYNIDIQNLFHESIKLMKKIDESILSLLLEETQSQILSLDKPYHRSNRV